MRPSGARKTSPSILVPSRSFHSTHGLTRPLHALARAHLSSTRAIVRWCMSWMRSSTATNCSALSRKLSNNSASQPTEDHAQHPAPEHHGQYWLVPFCDHYLSIFLNI